MKKMLNKFFNVVTPGPVLTGRKDFFLKSGGTYVTRESCMEASAFYRAVIYLSTQIAKLPMVVKDQGNREKPDSPISFLLNVAPNNETTSFQLKLFLIQCAIISGNGYCEIERTVDGRPIALWPLNPNRVSLQRDPTGKLWYQVTGGDSRGQTVYLQPRDVFHLRNFHTHDGLMGLGLIDYARVTLGINLGADTFANGLFTNGGLPSGVITAKTRMDDSTYERLKTSWKEQHSGKKTGGVAILEDGVTYNPISHSPDVLQFLESRQFSVEEISRFTGVPPQKLFLASASKYANMEQANLEVATDILDSWARNFESEADVKLLNNRRGGLRCELDLYSIFRGDMTTRAKYFNTMMQNAAITPNEIRIREGMEENKELNRFFIAANNFTPIDRLDEVIDSNIKSKEPDTKVPSNEEIEDDDEKALNAAALEFLRHRTEINR